MAALSYDPLPRLRDGFVIPFKARSYAQQFANVYFLRLARLREKLDTICRHTWPGHVPCRVLDIDPSRLSVVIGTVYCEMKLKPNVLEDLAREVSRSLSLSLSKQRPHTHSHLAPPLQHHLGPALGPRKWLSPDEDSIMLEDESGRVRLVGVDLQKYMLVTGIIIGARGRETSKGDFEVHEIVYAGVPDQPPPPRPQKQDQPLVALVSGLDLDNNNSSRAKARAETLVDWLNGHIGGDDERALAASVGRLLIAGNLTRASPAAEKPAVSQTKESAKLKRAAYEPATCAPPATDHADRLLSQLGLPIDIMPGPADPTIQSLPQQALHRCLFPTATAAKKPADLVMGPNPWWAEIGGTTFLGTSGQNLDDIYKYVADEDRLKLATQMLEWGHIAPTAPDTLHCYPLRDQDPFVLGQLPDVFFVGNQPAFGTALRVFGPPEKPSRTRVVLLPRFSKTGTIVLVHPTTLHTQAVRILPDFPLLDPSHPDDIDDDTALALLPPEKIRLDVDVGDDDDE
ncbi:hypothetical protein PtB15_14B478 [Puccinia triticina]|nr:hypothetical protein PtB15_14B478 [Puccinia triticina]